VEGVEEVGGGVEAEGVYVSFVACGGCVVVIVASSFVICATSI
jgi:hypothetical protein